MGSSFFLVIFLSAIFGSFAQSIDITPLPEEFTTGSKNLYLEPSSFVFNTTSKSEIISQAQKRYFDLIFKQPFTEHILRKEVVQGHKDKLFYTKFSYLPKLEIIIEDDSEHLFFGVDECYELKISSIIWNLKSKTVFGALKGLESFSQLVQSNGTHFFISSTPIRITDCPQLKWRGLFLSTAKNYLGVETILHVLDAMSYAKLNVLHWHLGDTNLFPFLDNFLKSRGFTHNGFKSIYHYLEIKKIVEYARLRGIRVVPEIDPPNGLTSSLVGFEDTNIDIFFECENFVSLNIANEGDVFNFLDKLVLWIGTLFPDDYFHFGGRNLDSICWDTFFPFKEWMKTRGFVEYIKEGESVIEYPHYDLVWRDFKTKLQGTAMRYKKNVIFFEEEINSEYPYSHKTTFSNVWFKKETSSYSQRVILSFGCDFERSKKIETLEDFYKEEFYSINSVMGAEITCLNEFLDFSNIDHVLWKKGITISEKMWSNNKEVDVKSALSRQSSFRCKMIKRGVWVGPLTTDFCDSPFNFPIKNITDHSLKSNSPSFYDFSYTLLVLFCVVLFLSNVILLTLFCKGKHHVDKAE